MRKLPTTSNRRSWSDRRKSQAWWALHLARRRRARAAGPLSLRDGLVAYWKLDENEGEVRMDSSGNNLHLTDYNGVGREEGLFGGSANCTYIDYDCWLGHPDHALLRFQGDFTVSCWVARFGTVWNSDTILNVTGSLFFYLDWTTDFKPILSLYDGDGVQFLFLVGEWNLTEDSWHHLVFYRKDNTFGIVTNNANHVTAIAAQSIGTGDFRIGANEAGYPFTGWIDEVAKWDRALSMEEISQLYNDGVGIPLEAFGNGSERR